MRNKFPKITAIPILTMLYATCLASDNLDKALLDQSPQTAGNRTSNKDTKENLLFFSTSQTESKNIINPAGGIAALEKIFTVQFPMESVASTTTVTLSVSASDDVDLVFKETTFMFPDIKRLPQELRVSTGKTPPNTDFILGKIYANRLQPRINVSVLTAYAMIDQGGADENSFLIFDPIETSYHEELNELTFKIPSAAFTEKLSNQGYQAVIILAEPPPNKLVEKAPKLEALKKQILLASMNNFETRTPPSRVSSNVGMPSKLLILG